VGETNIKFTDLAGFGRVTVPEEKAIRDCLPYFKTYDLIF
jgi:hypothetical protein